jgi:EPS-associated MarR family transcriptional regulator
MEILKKSSDIREDIGMLAVLDALESEKALSQRKLSAATGLNLKKINFCLHKLLEKGHIKFERVRQNPNKLVYLYLLTPDGVRAKSQMTYRFIKFTMEQYGKIEEKICRSLNVLAQTEAERVALYGVSDVARILFDLMNGYPLRVVGIVDDACEGGEFCGHRVLRSEALARLDYDRLLVTSLDDPERVDQRLLDLGVERKKIWRIA